jgi:hypothetical protein
VLFPNPKCLSHHGLRLLLELEISCCRQVAFSCVSVILALWTQITHLSGKETQCLSQTKSLMILLYRAYDAVQHTFDEPETQDAQQLRLLEWCPLA